MPLPTGTRLGPYEVVAPLGAGGMGEVYRATDTRLNRTVALKVLPHDTAADPEFRARLHREAQAIAGLSHPHVCVLHDIGQHDSRDFLVMELLEGETLAERLRRGPLPFPELVTYGIQMAEALAAAHRRGIVHRDLKPGNVMLTPRGVKVLDFGLAKAQNEALPGIDVALTQATPMTMRGTIMGTPGYIAPEQLHGREADARSDIFALGAILLEMATGSRAFHGDSQPALIAAVLEHDPLPKLAAAAVPPLFRRTVERCLAKNPEERWQDAADVTATLRWSTDQGTSPPPQSASRARLPWLLAGAAVLAAMAAIAVVLYATPPSDERVLRLSIVPPAGTNFVPRDITGTPHFALSPDGSAIVFVAAAPGDVPRLWLRTLDLTEARPLAGSEGATGPFWSPDSSQLGFFAGGKLKKLTLSAGTVQDLARITFDVTGGSWSPLGMILFAGPTNDGLYRIHENGGTAERATMLGATSGHIGHRWPQFLPDGRSFLFFVRSAKPNAGGVYVMPANSTTPRLILESRASAVYVEPGYLMFERNGALMAQPFDAEAAALHGEPIALDDRLFGHLGAGNTPLSPSAGGRLAYWDGVGLLTRVEIYDRGGTPIRQIGSQARYFGPELSRDGRRLLVMVRKDPATQQLLNIDLASGASSPLTFSGGIARFGVWSPDGSQVVLGSLESTGPRLVRKPASGAGQEAPVMDLSEHWAVFPEGWSRDGEWLLYGVAAPTAWDLWAVRLPDGKRLPLLDGPANEVQGQLSPDGRWLAYASDESGSWEVYVTSFPARTGTWQISPPGGSGGSQPRWSKDGSELFYIDGGGWMTSVTVQSATSFTTGPPRRMFPVKAVPTVAPFRISYDVSPDAKTFVVTSVVNEAVEPITVVHNWRSGLRQQ